MLNGRVFRLFLSSTFSDFIAEREALQNVVFPELEKYCRDRGASFQAVDLRWGITEKAQRDQDTMRICLEEIRRCQKLSPRPNFAVLLGDRYGWEPVPARISKNHWRRLKIAANYEDWELIKNSYRLDANALPQVYCLNKRTENTSVALNHEAKLLNALRRTARGFRGGARLPYFASATHQEIALGALSNLDDEGNELKPEHHVHVYVRQIEGLPKDVSAKDYIDWDDNLVEISSGARERLSGLESDLRKKLGGRVHDLHATWSQHGRNGAINKAYLKRFCEMFLTHQKALIEAELLLLKQSTEIQQRNEAHQEFGAERARVFVGRKVLLAKIARYVEVRNAISSKNKSKLTRSFAPLILLGGGGSGKSALLARSANEVQKLAKRSGTIVIQRYIGGVPGTESLMTMLTALTSDIAILYDQAQPSVPENAKALANAFQTTIGNASAKRPLIVYLDALDQLDSDDSAWMLEWLPKKLPEYVRVIASARTETRVEQSARRRYPRSLIELSSMSISEGRAMLGAWLADKRAAWFNAGIAPSKGRRLTAEQQQEVLAAFKYNGSALWLKLAYEEAATWKSWGKPRQLPTTVQGLIGDLIDNRLIKQENHPKVFTVRALSYLTAGRFGLSEQELDHAMATDYGVRAEFEVQNAKTGQAWLFDEKSPHLPPILWSRLYFDLQPYLSIAQVDGMLVYRWFHREFKDEIGQRLNIHDNHATHEHLACTFKALDLKFQNGPSNGESMQLVRRVREEPFHREIARDNKGLLESFAEQRFYTNSILLDKFEFLRQLLRLNVRLEIFFKDHKDDALIDTFLFFAKGELFRRDFGIDLVAISRDSDEFGAANELFAQGGYRLTGRSLCGRRIFNINDSNRRRSSSNLTTAGVWQFLICSEFVRGHQKSWSFSQRHYPRYLMAAWLRQQDQYFTSENYELATLATWFPFPVLIRGRNKLTFFFDDAEFDLQESFLVKMKEDLKLLELAISKIGNRATDNLGRLRIKTLSGKPILSTNEDLLRAIAFEAVVLGRRFRSSCGIFRGYCLLDDWDASPNRINFALPMLIEQLNEDPAILDSEYLDRLQKIQVEVFGEIIWGRSQHLSLQKVGEILVNGLDQLKVSQRAQFFLMKDTFHITFLHLLPPILGKESFSDFLDRTCYRFQPDSLEEQQARVGIAYVELLGCLMEGSIFN